MSLAVGFPGNLNFSGTVSAPLFVSNQQIIAPVAAGTASTLTTGSLSATFLSASSFTSLFGSINQAYASTLSVGTILNFSAGGTISSSGTTSTSYSSGTLTVVGGASFLGTITSTGLGINQTSPLYPLDLTGSARISLVGGTVSTPSLICGIGTFNNLMLCPSLASGNYNNIVASGDAGLIFGTSNSGTFSMSIAPWAVASSGIRIANAGAVCNVGINQPSPSFSLDVSGSARFTGTITTSIRPRTAN